MLEGFGGGGWLVLECIAAGSEDVGDLFGSSTLISSPLIQAISEHPV